MSGRLTRWQPAAGATVIVALLLAWPWDADASWKLGVWSLRAIAVLLTLGGGFALDDAAAEIVASSPTTLRARMLFRLGLSLAWAVPVWGVSLLVMAPWIAPVWLLWSSLEFAALFAAGLSVAALMARWYGQSEPGTVTSTAVVGGWLVIFALPGPLAMFTLRPQDLGPAHVRWGLLLGLGAVVLWATSRDPSHGRRRRGLITTRYAP
ncbi:hypothetical protein [Microbispora sp. H11081]|uniref:hypothetical protein n=1 Tax=Microbispora sp. H11081 TaxID=2729107 RepID=UPI0014766676|nr:hypothetical protein [Microbispora sp. H11081]